MDDFFGTKVADPYRWLENSDTPDTRAWIDAENKVTFDYLAQIPERARIKARLTEIWNYERYGTPSREGPWYIFAKNSGLQPQAVVYKTKSLDAAPEVLIDPNTLSKDGTVALGETSFSDDGRYIAYSLAASGSDWIEWRVRDVATSQDLPDLVKWSKFSGASWLKDGSGFFYSRYDEPKGEALQALNKNQKVFFHKLGTPQDKDALVYERPDKPDWGFGADVTEDGRFLLVYQTEGTDNRNRVFVRDLKKPGSDDRAVPRRVRRQLLGRRQRRRHVLRPDQQERAALPSGGDSAVEAGRGRVEDARSRSARHVRARGRDDGERPVRDAVDDRRPSRGAGVRPGRQARSGGRAADARRRRRPDRPARPQGDVLLVRVVPLPDGGLPLRLRQPEERGLQEAGAGVRPGGVRDGAGLLQRRRTARGSRCS